MCCINLSASSVFPSQSTFFCLTRVKKLLANCQTRCPLSANQMIVRCLIGKSPLSTSFVLSFAYHGTLLVISASNLPCHKCQVEPSSTTSCHCQCTHILRIICFKEISTIWANPMASIPFKEQFTFFGHKDLEWGVFQEHLVHTFDIASISNTNWLLHPIITEHPETETYLWPEERLSHQQLPHVDIW